MWYTGITISNAQNTVVRSVQHTERTALGGETSKSNLEINTDIVGAGQCQDITRDVTLGVGAEGSDVSNTSGIVALNGSVAQLASDRCSVRLSGHGSGQHSDGGEGLEDRRHDETGSRRIEW
jgi:hypothetical protein